MQFARCSSEIGESAVPNEAAYVIFNVLLSSGRKPRKKILDARAVDLSPHLVAANYYAVKGVRCEIAS